VQIRLQYDDGVLADIGDIRRVEREITGMFSDPVVRRRLADDPYGAYQIDGRVNPMAIAREFVRKPVDVDALTLVLTGYDLAPPKLNYSYGATWKGVVSVVSTHRMGGSALKTAIVGLHELLHQIGLVGESQPQYDHRAGFDGHCRNRCLMRAVNGPSDMEAVVADWRRGIKLCGQCAGI